MEFLKKTNKLNYYLVELSKVLATIDPMFILCYIIDAQKRGKIIKSYKSL